MKRLALIIPLCFMGCAGLSTEGDRLLIHQDIGASQAILEASSDPLVIGPAQDIKRNSEQLQRGLGAPEAPTPYSPAASSIYRQQAATEHAAMGALWSSFKAGISSTFGGPLGALIPGLGGIGGLAIALLKTYQARKTKTDLADEQTAHQHTARAFEEVSVAAPEAAAKPKEKLKKAHVDSGVQEIGKRVAGNV